MKTGPFAEHSNQLWNISAVPSWSKVNQGLIRMYKAEVSGGRPAPSVPGLLLPAPPTPLFCPADTRGLGTSIRGLPVRKALDRGPLCPAAGGGGGWQGPALVGGGVSPLDRRPEVPPSPVALGTQV